MTNDELKTKIADLMKNGKDLSDRIQAAEAQIRADTDMVAQIKGAISAFQSMIVEEADVEEVKESEKKDIPAKPKAE